MLTNLYAKPGATRAIAVVSQNHSERNSISISGLITASSASIVWFSRCLKDRQNLDELEQQYIIEVGLVGLVTDCIILSFFS